MDRSIPLLLLVLVVAVLGVGVVTYRADQHARADAARERCLEKAHATATVALLAPAEQVDEQGRLDAMHTLGRQLEAC